MATKIIDAANGIVKVTPKRRKVAIIGNGLTRRLAPYDDKSWEFWGLNEIPQKRAERYFEMHPMSIQTQRELEWLKKCNQPVYVLELTDKVPMGVVYPYRNVLSVAGARIYFTSTFSYQVALALYEGFEEIGLWGVNLAAGSPRERLVERACVEWWLGLAIGKNVKVTIGKGDKLLKQNYLYGYDYYAERTDIQLQVDSFVLRSLERK